MILVTVKKKDLDLGGIDRHQALLERAGGLHWYHWVILSMSFVITLFAWNMSRTLLEEQSRSRIESAANRVVTNVKSRLATYENALIAGVAAIHSHNGSMTRGQWRQFASTLDLTNRYSGVSGIGYLQEVPKPLIDDFVARKQRSQPGFRIFPSHSFSVSLPIIYIEPVEGNARSIGLDMAFEDNRRTAALQARDLDVPQISGPITLVQDEEKSPGFQFFAPVFLDGVEFDGLVFAPVLVDKLIDGALLNRELNVRFSIADGDSVIFSQFDEAADAPVSSTYTLSIDTEVYGRTWTFTVSDKSAIDAEAAIGQPTVVLISGLFVDSMLFVLFLLLTKSSQRVLTLASSMTREMQDQTQVLEQKNAELESFAYVVSHDLKTPVRAIHCLVSFMEDDLEEQSVSDEAREVMTEHLQRIHEQVERSQALIDGILSFSVIGHEQDAPQRVEVRALLQSVGCTLRIPDRQLSFRNDLPVFDTYTIRLTQVFENLINNAYKYHPSPGSALISVRSERVGDFYRFFVIDNGKGIDEKYHSRIFKPFQTLESQPTPNSSGLGLSIVKKSVENLGGKVGIWSTSEHGTTFYFDWPVVVASPVHDTLQRAA